MAGNVIAYSGLITKTRAMKKKLLSREQLRQLTELATVNEAVSFLRTTGGYEDIYRNDVGEWHRGQAEAMIRKVLWRDYEKLYHFSTARQREALELVFDRYETNFLKECVKRLFQEEPAPMMDRGVFFRRHASIAVEEAEAASDLQGFLRCLKGTSYEKALLEERRKEPGYAGYAFRLDRYYYDNVYKKLQHQKNSQQKRLLMQIYGTQIDWLNIMWAYRFKRFFSGREADVSILLIPVHYRLRRQELDNLIGAESVSEMNHILENTGYFKGKDAYLKMEDEMTYQQVMQKTYQLLARKYPMSMAPVLQYLYEREIETERITSVIEGVRYQIPPRDIRDYILLAT